MRKENESLEARQNKCKQMFKNSDTKAEEVQLKTSALLSDVRKMKQEC